MASFGHCGGWRSCTSCLASI